MAERVVYYTDPLNDDFAGTNIKTRRVPADFPFVHRSKLWRAAAFLLYYGIAWPLVWLISKVWLGLRIKNKKVLKKAGKQGFFLYGNHTRYLDAFLPAMSAGHRKAYVVAGPDAVSIRGLRWVVQMLGVLPLPSDHAGAKPFFAAMERRIAEGQAVAIFPEAHIWPFYNGIRPFKSTSFRYPARLGAPVFSMTAVYRKRWWCKVPAMTVCLDGPFYPDPALSEKQAAERLREQVYSRMCRTVEEEKSVAYIQYVQKNTPPAAPENE